MKSKSAWTRPGWPWELELLTFIFVLIATFVPFYLHYIGAPTAENASLLQQAAPGTNPGMQTIREQTGFLWALAIVGLYVVHLILAGTGLAYISTPFTHLLTPLVFAMIAYFRLLSLSRESQNTIAIVSGSPWQLILWPVGVITITLLLARTRMARYLLNFKDVKWEITSPTHVDKSFIELLIQIQPLLYMPRVYRAGEKGILIEGWFYIAAIPFDLIHSITAINHANISTSGHYFATSSHSLIRLELRDDPLPFFISPQDRDAFLKYCAHRIAHLNHRTTASHAGDTKTRRTDSGTGSK